MRQRNGKPGGLLGWGDWLGVGGYSVSTMTIEHDSNLPPLRVKVPPVVPVDSVLAVGDVTLAAADVPRGILRQFYGEFLGLTFVDAEVEVVRFTQNNRMIRLDRNHAEAGRLALLISSRHFSEVLERLRGRQLPFELIHTDAGLTRLALLRDPALNWIHLMETRPF